MNIIVWIVLAVALIAVFLAGCSSPIFGGAKQNWMGIVSIFLTVVLAGFLGDAFLGEWLNWPNAGSVVAVAVMGILILVNLRRRLDEDQEA